jgi:signal transduction histidine kinase/CheY-like chemotaxis protein
MALRTSARSVPLQLVAVACVVALGWQVGRELAALVCGALGLAVGLWRLHIARRYCNPSKLGDDDLQRAQRALELNSALAGVTWAVGTFGVYPWLRETTATVYVVIVCGSLAVGAFFMSLFGRSFMILAILQLGALVIVSLGNNGMHSVPLALLAVVFGVTMVLASREFLNTARLAIRHGFDAEAAGESLLRAKEAAEAANLAKSQFLATMSHEIRTPMNGVLGALELLRQSRLDESQRKLLKTAISSGASLMAILNDVLDHSKIEAGKLNLAHVPMSLHSVATSATGLFRANAEGKGLWLSLDIEPGVADAVLGDAQRLKQVLLNLLGNAIKFTERGRVMLRLGSEPAPDGKARVRFEVLDTGIGISPESILSLFDPFHQVHGKRDGRLGGTGLGLAISQRIVQAMGGQIEVDSEPGRGSRFRFTLVFERADANAPVPADSVLGSLDELSTGLAGTALVVEDNPTNRMIALAMLNSLGVKTIEAENGAEALEKLEHHPVDVVLMDCHMPVMDGYAAAMRIRQRESSLGLKRVPIVALTADAFEDDAAHALASGMDAHLAKPYTRGQLKQMLALWL